MLCAMRGYSHMKGGKGKMNMQQHDTLFVYFHGRPPSRPSQIKMLCDGGVSYSAIYDSIQRVATSKKDTVQCITDLVLKWELHRDGTRKFRATKEINNDDLEKKTPTSLLLVTGWTLLAIGQEGESVL